MPGLIRARSCLMGQNAECDAGPTMPRVEEREMGAGRAALHRVIGLSVCGSMSQAKDHGERTVRLCELSGLSCATLQHPNTMHGVSTSISDH